MMVETILESSQDFGMSNGALPQWKRELLQRRAARSRPAPPPQPPPPPPPHPPPPPDDDEELRYGPGIVKRLKSRYLSLALRDAPRRRPSVLRRAASLEHLLDERPPPAPARRAPRPASVAAPPAAPAAARRDSVKRARSVDALSRLDARDEPRAPSPSPPPPPAPRPAQLQPRAARPPRRPTPLLRETERPPPDVVRSTLRKFESVPTKRAAPAARVSAVLRGLEGPRTSTPEPRDVSEPPPLSPRTPSPLPAVDSSAVAPGAEEWQGAGGRPVSRAALEGIARAGSSVRYAFEAPRAGSHLPPLSATNPVLLGRARRVGVIRPMPARTNDEQEDSHVDEVDEKFLERSRLASPSPTPPPESEAATGRPERKEPPPAALVEPIPRPPVELAPPNTPPPPVPVERTPSPEPKPKPKVETIATPLLNGHATPERTPETKCPVSKIGAAGIERAWSGSGERKTPEVNGGAPQNGGSPAPGAPWARGSPAPGRRTRAPAPSSTSVVFNFSNRKEVPDYIENDGIILRNKRNRIKPGEPGVVVLRPEALQKDDSDSESEVDCGPPSPCSVKFVNDNVLINGKSMLGRPNRDRLAKIKLQFDDSLTRTFEYPSETSFCEEGAGEAPPPASPAPPTPPAPLALAESPHHAPLAANTHIASAALSRYTPHKTAAGAFQLGVTRHESYSDTEKVTSPAQGSEALEDECSDARPCGAGARSWSEARTHATDLLF